jgi:phage-related baseplate assembly protein
MVSTVIDLSQLPPPDAIEALSSADLKAAYIDRFKTAWTAARVLDPTLPDYDVQTLETDPAIIVGEAFSYLRLLDRARVNDAVRAVLAPLARGTDLDNVVARWDVQRLVVTPAAGLTPAVMETDAQLLRRYLMAVDRPSAGSRDRYLYEAFTAWPGMLDASVIGRDVHQRPGDVDIVIIGPNGDAPTSTQIMTVSAAVNASDVKPEATSVSVVGATRTTYGVALRLDVPKGPDASLVVADAQAYVAAAVASRMRIGAEAPIWSITGAAYRPNVIRVNVDQPTADVPADPYSIPVCTGINITAEVKT